MTFVNSRGVRTFAGLFSCLAIASAGMGAASAAPATGEILAEGGVDAIPNRYIVTFADQQLSAQDVHGQAQSLVSRYGGDLRYHYSAALRGFSVTMPAESARRLAADPQVDFVEQSHLVHAAGTQQDPPSYGVDRIDQRDLPLDQTYEYQGAGKGITVYDIDTGVNKEHPDFEGRASYGPDLINDDEESEDDNGHGSHTAGTIVGKTFGVAKQAELVAIKVLDEGGSGPDEAIIKALDWVVQNGAKPGVINMSLTSDQHPHKAMNEATNKASEAGFLSAVAAGNDGGDSCQNSPASAPSALTVAATGEQDNKASFSSVGKCVDLFAPGENITSASHQGDGNANMSGTSMSAPHVAGAAAIYFADHKDASVQQAHDDIVAAASEGKVDQPGEGTPNKLLFVGQE